MGVVRRKNTPGGALPPGSWHVLRHAGHPDAADRLDHDAAIGQMTDVDRVRLGTLLQRVSADMTSVGQVADHVRSHGAAALPHASGQRDLPERITRHVLERGQVRVGLATGEPRNPHSYRNKSFALDTEVLTTSLLVLGPPGSGKTRSFARPVLEHLSLQALAGRASVVAVDPKGDDFDIPGLFDITIDATDPEGEWGFDLYGGATDPDQASDRLSSALLPAQVSDDKTYFADAARNALYQTLAPFHAAYDRYPSIPELLDLLAGNERRLQSITDKLTHKGLLDDHQRHLDARARQRGRRDDPASSLVERLSLLDRPSLVGLFDKRPKKFSMQQVNEPVRVRVVVPEAEFPEASRILARLTVSQFVQAVGGPRANRDILKMLVVDEAGRYVDDYVARAVQRIRSNNAGLVLLTQTLGDIPDELRRTIFGSVGCKVTFAGIDPQDARYLADWWGTRWTAETTFSRGQTSGHSVRHGGWLQGDVLTTNESQNSGVSMKQVERDLWSPSEIINDVPPGHCLVTLARPNGERTPPVLVNVRA